MDEIDKIADDLKTCDDPVSLSGYLTKLAGWNAFYTEMLKKIMLVKPQKWLELKTISQIDETKREKDLSDKHTDILWQTTNDGQKEIALTYEIKRIDTMYKAISKRLWAMEQEFRKLNV